MGSIAYEEQLTAEAASWLIEDPVAREEKLRRERIRHPKLIRDLQLHMLDPHTLDVLEVGGGPAPLSDLLQCKSRVVIDPLTNAYKTLFPCPDHIAGRGERGINTEAYDLAICTNALDHTEDPARTVASMAQGLRPGGYMAIMCAENNALTNPHPAHAHNLTAEWVHRQLDKDFETVWELTFAEHGYRYGWVSYQGRRGQPAFALLLRRCSGY